MVKLSLIFMAVILSSCSSKSGSKKSPEPSNNLSSICPTNYILVSKNNDLGVPADFCVMKYEARAQDKATSDLHPQGCSGDCSTKNWALSDPTMPHQTGTNELLYQPASSNEGRPWRSIDLATAKAACSDLGKGHALISNSEWMTIAQSIEQVSSNWQSGDGDVGLLSKGYAANPALYDADGPAPSSAASCLYSNNDNTCGESGNPVDRRTLLLFTKGDGEIWDFAGNVWEWVDWTIENPALKASYNGATGWVEFNRLNTNIDEENEMAPVTWAPHDLSLESANGIGRYRRSGNTQTAAYRGGRWDSGINGGIYSLYMDTANAGNYSIGFRCVYHPD